jgi:hypothetical protein
MFVEVKVGHKDFSKTWTAEVQIASVIKLYNVLRNRIPKEYKLTVQIITKCNDHTGNPHFTSLMQLVDAVSSFRFIKEIEFEEIIPRYIKVGSFYKKPFSVETSIHDGCVYSFFKDYNPKVVVHAIEALQDLLPNKCIRKSTTGYYYCIGEYLMLYNEGTNRWNLLLRDGDSIVTRSKIIDLI